MPSPSYTEWHREGLSRLDELERLHIDARGPGPGRRWGTEQLNRSLLVALVAQFQTYCRGLHDDAIDVHVSHNNAHQGDLLRTLMTQGRKLDTRNPRTSVLASDFLGVGFNMVSALKAEGPMIVAAIASLDALVDFRNAVVHGNETEIAGLSDAGQVKATMTSYRAHRRTVIRVVDSMDRVTARQLGQFLRVPPPW